MPRDFGPKQLKLKRDDVRVRTGGGLTALVWKDRREICVLTWTHHQQKEIFMATVTALWNLTSWNSRTGTWVTLTILILWLTAIWWVDVPSSGPQNCFSTFWIQQYSTFGYHYFNVGLNIPAGISGSFWWGIWLRKLEGAKITPTPDWLEDQVRAQKMFCDSRVIITGQQNHQPNGVAFSVLPLAKEGAQCINAPDVMWAGEWCLVSWNITPK